MYETFEHTADLGLRIRAGDLNTLFADAGRALFSVIIANTADVRATEQVTIELTATDRTDLLFDWLNELLYLFDTRHLLLVEFDVQVSKQTLTAMVRGEPFDPTRHPLEHEVKAITYHELKVDQTPEGWLAEVIVDI